MKGDESESVTLRSSFVVFSAVVDASIRELPSTTKQEVQEVVAMPLLPNGRRQFLLDAAYILNDRTIKALSDREFRCLVKLWCHACLFGGIPSDEPEQAAIVGLRIDYWRASSDLALSWFRPSSDLEKLQLGLSSELLVCPMMLADAEAYASSIEKRKASGRMGGLASGVSRRSKREASASTETKQNEATSPHLTTQAARSRDAAFKKQKLASGDAVSSREPEKKQPRRVRSLAEAATAP